MTRSEFETVIGVKCDTMRTLVARLDQASALGLRITGWVLTIEEWFALGGSGFFGRLDGGRIVPSYTARVGLGDNCPYLPVKRIIEERV